MLIWKPGIHPRLVSWDNHQIKLLWKIIVHRIFGITRGWNVMYIWLTHIRVWFSRVKDKSFVFDKKKSCIWFPICVFHRAYKLYLFQCICILIKKDYKMFVFVIDWIKLFYLCLTEWTWRQHWLSLVWLHIHAVHSLQDSILCMGTTNETVLS